MSNYSIHTNPTQKSENKPQGIKRLAINAAWLLLGLGVAYGIVTFLR
ncbi:hypothetical protein [Timonella sp. A28]